MGESPKREPTVEESWSAFQAQPGIAEYRCRVKLETDDPTVEWRKTESQRQEGRIVVKVYGTRNAGLVTGVCHVVMKGSNVSSIRSWVK
jgi:hypothetical protein